MRHRRVDHRPRLDPSGPAHEHRHADAAFEQRQLPPAIRGVDLGQAYIARAAIIAGKDDDRVVVEPLLLQRRHDPPDAAIERAHHRGIDAQAVRLDIAHRLVIRLGRLQRGVDVPVRKIQEERAVAVRLDHLDRLVGPVICQIAAGLEPVAAIVAGGILHPRPEELVDRVEGQLGVDRVRVVLGQMQRAGHQQALVEALRIGAEFRSVAQMPLADMDAVIARRFQDLGDRALAAGQTLAIEIGRAFDRCLLVGQWRQTRIHLRRQRRDDAPHTIGGGGELEPGTRRITPGEDHRPRWGAARSARIGVGIDRTLARQPVDIGGRHQTACDAAAKGRDVVDAEVIGEDEDDVGRALAGRERSHIGALLPGNRPVGRDIVLAEV